MGELAQGTDESPHHDDGQERGQRQRRGGDAGEQLPGGEHLAVALGGIEAHVHDQAGDHQRGHVDVTGAADHPLRDPFRLFQLPGLLRRRPPLEGVGDDLARGRNDLDVGEMRLVLHGEDGAAHRGIGHLHQRGRQGGGDGPSPRGRLGAEHSAEVGVVGCSSGEGECRKGGHHQRRDLELERRAAAGFPGPVRRTVHGHVRLPGCLQSARMAGATSSSASKDCAAPLPCATCGIPNTSELPSSCA